MGSDATSETKRRRYLKKSLSPRLQKLEDDFVKAGGEWREKAICELFRKIPTKKLPYKARDLQGKHDEVYSLPALTAGVENQGLAYFVPKEGATVLRHCISVSANGANTGVMFYQSKEFTVLQDSYAIEFIEHEISDLSYLYFVGALQKSIRYRFDWSNKAGWDRIKTEKITIPYINKEIAFKYMETYIKTLEAERIETLEAYLTVTGLRDYHLTKNDEEILDKFAKLSDTKSRVEEWGTYAPFFLEKILRWCQGIKELNPLHLDSLEDLSQPIYPFYGQATMNNGIISYRQLKNDVLNNKKGLPTLLIHSNNQNIVYLETPFYLKDGHGATSVLQSEQLNRYTGLYFMTTIKRVIEQRFNYNSKATKIGLKHTKIVLPILNDKIDYYFMIAFIKVIEKLVIKDLVEWTDQKIEATKEVVGQY